MFYSVFGNAHNPIEDRVKEKGFMRKIDLNLAATNTAPFVSVEFCPIIKVNHLLFQNQMISFSISKENHYLCFV